MDANTIAFIIFLIVFVGAFLFLYIKSIFEAHGG